MSFVSNKTFVVTGASRGIGRDLCRLLAMEGASLVVNARNEDDLRAAMAEPKALGAAVKLLAGNAAHAEVARQLVATAAEMGNFGGFFHVAGVLAPGPYLWELGEEQFDAIFGASVKAAWQVARFAVPEMLKAGEGLGVFFGSGASTIVQPGIGAYCAAKAAEEHLARQFAAEADHLAIFSYQPYIVETNMQKQAREAVGGAAEGLRELFGSWKDAGELISPQQAAQGLMDLIADDPLRWRGKTMRWERSGPIEVE